MEVIVVVVAVVLELVVAVGTEIIARQYTTVRLRSNLERLSVDTSCFETSKSKTSMRFLEK